MIESSYSVLDNPGTAGGGGRDGGGGGGRVRCTALGHQGSCAFQHLGACSEVPLLTGADARGLGDLSCAVQLLQGGAGGVEYGDCSETSTVRTP